MSTMQDTDSSHSAGNRVLRRFQYDYVYIIMLAGNKTVHLFVKVLQYMLYEENFMIVLNYEAP